MDFDFARNMGRHRAAVREQWCRRQVDMFDRDLSLVARARWSTPSIRQTMSISICLMWHFCCTSPVYVDAESSMEFNTLSCFRITRRTRQCIWKLLKNLGRSPATEKLKRNVLTMEGLEGPNTQDKAERFMAATGHHLEDLMATYHPLGIAGEVAGKIVQHPVGLPTTLQEIW